jgi:hypothetical protein
MVALVGFYWGWLLASLLLGLGMGWICVVQHGDGLSKQTTRWLAIAGVVLLGLSLARVIPGRPGYWLDLGLLMSAAYLIGCVVGSWLRDRVVSRHASGN